MSNYPHIGLLTTGKEFYEAAKSLNNGPQSSGASFPNYYLYFHSIELGLKSFLKFNGVEEKELREIGHDLENAFNEAEKYNISDLFSDLSKLRACIKKANPMYCGKELEYFYPGFRTLPEIGPVHDAVESLIKVLENKYRSDLKNERKIT